MNLMKSEQCMNSKVKILGEGVYSPNLRDVAELESVQSRLIFSYKLAGKNYREMNVF